MAMADLTAVSSDANSSESSTCLETIRVMHKWKIESFTVHTELCSVGDALCSTVFGSSDGQYKFLLRLYPVGKDEECRGYVSLFLQIRDCPSPKARFRVNFFLETTEGPKGCALNRNIVTINKNGIVTASRFFSVDFLKARAPKFLQDDTLAVGCELYIYGEAMSKVRHCPPGLLVPDSTMSRDMGGILERQEHTDCVLTVAEQEFKAHKAILCARSPVFQAMFQDGGLEEARSSSAVISDVAPEAFAALLRYVYTDECPREIDELPEEILVAADKYGLDRLRTLCEVCLCKDLSISNVCNRLRVADVYRASELKSQALSFIQSHCSEVLASESWSDFQNDCPRLAAEILKHALMANQPSGSGGRTHGAGDEVHGQVPAKRIKMG